MPCGAGRSQVSFCKARCGADRSEPACEGQAKVLWHQGIPDRAPGCRIRPTPTFRLALAPRLPLNPPIDDPYRGEVTEWSIVAVSKTVDPSRGPWVRIPPSPPIAQMQLLSVPSAGRKLLLYSGVMARRLSTAATALVMKTALSGSFLSKADDCADLVLSFKPLFLNDKLLGSFCAFAISVWSEIRTGIEILRAVAHRHLRPVQPRSGDLDQIGGVPKQRRFFC